MPEKENATVISGREGGVRGNVELSHVYFSYTEEQKLIEDFNLKVQPWPEDRHRRPHRLRKNHADQPADAFLRRDGRKNQRRGLRRAGCDEKEPAKSFGMVLQDTWLKAGTIRENIGMGKPDATEEEIIAAAKASHAHSFIKRLPQGYETGDYGRGRRGSPRGRSSFCVVARVMLCLPPMLILDEATSSIDTRTEMKIQEAFLRMMEWAHQLYRSPQTFPPSGRRM